MSAARCTPGEALAALERRARRDGYLGWDPFDGLESRLFKALPFSRAGLPRLAWQQLFKRSPINLRRVALVPPTLNPATLALFSRGHAVLGQAAERDALNARLLDCRSRDWPGPGRGWSYPFDWQARAFAVPKGVPNVIATAYAVRALASDTSDRAAAAIVDAGRFVAETLVRRRDGRTYLGYVPGSDAMVHNASLWAAYVLAEAAARGGPGSWRALALDAIRYSVDAQEADGSWRYGEAGHHGFRDSFHTGYNIEALHLCAGLLATEEWREPIRGGLAHYEQTFFTADGQPKYYRDRLWPADPTCTAQAMVTLLEVEPTPTRAALADRVLNWTLRHLWLPRREAFAYQKHAGWTNRMIYIRWTQAWMFLGLAVWTARTGRPCPT